MTHTEAMETETPPKMIWPCLNCVDPHAAMDFLEEAFGFVRTAVHEDDHGNVAHAEMRFPEGGGIMVGTASSDGGPFNRIPTGIGLYVVTDEPDALFERATKAGAEVVQGLYDADYGSRGFTVKDPEGNLWSFGTYRGT